jgi:GT2 family glycosyltransferase
MTKRTPKHLAVQGMPLGKEVAHKQDQPVVSSPEASISAQTLETSTGADLPLSSLIICSRNRPQFLADLVESILQGHELPTEIVIIDDGDLPHPTLTTLRSHRTCQIRYHWTHSAGLSRANNDGIAAARHDLLVFSQDDVLATPTWFGTIVRALIEAGQKSVVTGRVLPGETEASGVFAPSTISDEATKMYEGRIGKDVLFMQNMAMYRSAFEEVGPFDERLGPGTPFPGAEDNDFALRLLETGYRIWYVPQAVVYHRAWRTGRDYLPLYWNYGRAQGAYYAKHWNFRDRYMLWRMSKDIGYYALRIPVRALGQPRLACANAVYLVGLVLGALRWFVVHRIAQT